MIGARYSRNKAKTKYATERPRQLGRDKISMLEPPKAYLQLPKPSWFVGDL